MNHLPIRAKVYITKIGNTAQKAFASVDIGGLLYINSYTVSTTSKRPDRLSVYPPSRRATAGDFKPFIEFLYNGENPLVAAIYKACISAYKLYEDTGQLHQYGETFEVEIDKILNLNGDNALNTTNIETDDIDNFDIGKELEKAGL